MVKVVVGQNTIVRKVTVGTPLRVGSAANGSLTGLDDVNGTNGLAHGTILQYDSATNKFIHTTLDSANGSVTAQLSVTDAGGDGSLSYDSSSGIFTYTGPSATEVRSHFVAGANITYDSATGIISSTGPADTTNTNLGLTTDSLVEGSTNLYYKDSRGRAALSVNDAGGLGSLSYDSLTGVFTFNGPTTSDIRNQIVAGTNITYDSSTGVISSSGIQASDVRNQLVAGPGISYDSATGVISNTASDTTRSDSSIRALISAVDAGGFGSFGYDSSTGILTYTGIDSAAIRSVISAGGDLSFDDATGEISFTETASIDSATIRSLFSVNHSGFGSLSYDASTGVFTHTSPDDSNFRRAIIANDQGGLGSFSYDSQFGVMTYTGPSADSVYAQFTFGESNGSLGKLRLDSSSGSVTLALAKDSIRSLFQTVNTDVYDSFHGISYDSATGTITYKGPDATNFRGMLSVDSTIDQSLGFGRFNYFAGDSAGYGGKLRYFAPTADSVYSVFKAGVGIDYDSTTGTFSTDSQADVVFKTLTVTDSAVFSGKVAFADTLSVGLGAGLVVDSIRSTNNNITIDPQNDDSTAGRVIIKGDLEVQGFEAVLRVPQFQTTDPRIQLGIELTDSNSLDLAGFSMGYLPNDPLYMVYLKAQNQFLLSRGLQTYGPLTGPTIDRIDSAIDALPDSAQVRGLISTDGNGLSYNSTTGVISFDSSADVTVNQLRGPANFIIDPAAVGDNTGTVQILGNLQVEGTQTVINSTTVSINDKNILLADSAANAAAADGAGITIGGANATFQYSAGTDRWIANKHLQTARVYADSSIHTNQIYADSFYGTISSIANFSTDSLSEGPTNLYYTDTRVRSAISGGAGLTYNQGTGQFLIPSSGVTSGTYGTATTVPQVTVDSLGFVDSVGLIPISTVNNISFDSTNGILSVTTATETFSTPLSLDPYTTDSLAEGSTNLYFTEARARASLKIGTPQLIYDSATGTLAYDQGNTDSVAEGSTNLYFTDARARASLRVSDQGGSGSLTYDSATGGLVYVGPNKEDLKTVLSTLTPDSLGDLRWDPNYGFRADSDIVMNKDLIVGDSINTSVDFMMMYSGLNNGLRKVTLSTLSTKIGGGGGGAGGSLFGFINL